MGIKSSFLALTVFCLASAPALSHAVDLTDKTFSFKCQTVQDWDRVVRPVIQYQLTQSYLKAGFKNVFVRLGHSSMIVDPLLGVKKKTSEIVAPLDAAIDSKGILTLKTAKLD